MDKQKQINLKEYKFINGDNNFLKNNWDKYLNYLKENHLFYKKYKNMSIKDINKEFEKVKNIHFNKWILENWFLCSLITTFNYGRSFEDSLINAMLQTKNKKSLIEYKILMTTKDKEGFN